jgi:hypothetical protein
VSIEVSIRQKDNKVYSLSDYRLERIVLNKEKKKKQNTRVMQRREKSRNEKKEKDGRLVLKFPPLSL